MNTEQLIQLGYEEEDLCEDCDDAIATTLRGYGVGQKQVCTDCFHEMGV
jgi:hypothetical protein